MHFSNQFSKCTYADREGFASIYDFKYDSLLPQRLIEVKQYTKMSSSNQTNSNFIIEYDEDNPLYMSKVTEALTNKVTTYSWNYGKLVSVNDNITYKYDYVKGVRLQKKVNEEITNYYYSGSKLIQEQVGDKKISYLYEGSKLIGLKLNDNVYYYVYNLLNVIVGIVRTDGIKLVTYSYDAFGN